MENQGYSRVEKAKNLLNVYVDNASSSKILNQEHLINIKYVGKPDIYLSDGDSIVVNREKIKDIDECIPYAHKNLHTHFRQLSKLKSISNAYENNLELCSKKYERLNKKTNSRIRKIRKKYFESSNSSNHPENIYFHKTKSDEINSLLSKLTSISSFSREFLKLKSFNSYESCQFLIHEKGKSQVTNYYYNIQEGNQKSYLPIRQYNKLFNVINKSKSKLFDQSIIQSNCVNLMGFFLAKEFKLKKHTLLFLISRNGFLQPTSNELDFFNKFVPYLNVIFEKLLLQEVSIENNKYLHYVLENYPYPLEIFDSNKKTKFKNQQMTIYANETLPDTLEKCSFNIPNHHTVEMYTPSSNDLATDVFHHQRVSLLGELLNTLQHELSNPLFGLKLSTDLMVKNSLDQDSVELFEDMSNNITRCQNIIKNFSNLYKDSDVFNSIEVKNLIKETFTLAKSEIYGIPFEINFIGLGDHHEFKLLTNPTWLTQILFNLIVNAAQAIKTLNENLRHHKIIVSIHEDSINSATIISVSDTGPGISNELKQQPFEPFFTTKKQGTGLGLSICKNLCQRLGGSIDFYNNSPLKGSTFNIVLPIRAEHQEDS